MRISERTSTIVTMEENGENYRLRTGRNRLMVVVDAKSLRNVRWENYNYAEKKMLGLER